MSSETNPYSILKAYYIVGNISFCTRQDGRFDQRFQKRDGRKIKHMPEVPHIITTTFQKEEEKF